MTVLGFDASTLACSACVLKDGKIISSRYQNTGLTHSQTLLPMIQSVLTDAKITVDQLDRIAVTVGPGSFTGIKIAVATAKGLAHKNKTPCAAISSLRALADGIGFQGTVCAVEDARRSMLYNANFKDGKRLCEDRQISVESLIQEAEEPLLFCGDGAEIALNEALKQNKKAVAAAPDRMFIRAETVARLGDEAPEESLLSPEWLEPLYLRLPQAERERLEKANNSN